MKDGYIDEFEKLISTDSCGDDQSRVRVSSDEEDGVAYGHGYCNLVAAGNLLALNTNSVTPDILTAFADEVIAHFGREKLLENPDMLTAKLSPAARKVVCDRLLA